MKTYNFCLSSNFSKSEFVFNTDLEIPFKLNEYIYIYDDFMKNRNDNQFYFLMEISKHFKVDFYLKDFWVYFEISEVDKILKW